MFEWLAGHRIFELCFQCRQPVLKPLPGRLAFAERQLLGNGPGGCDSGAGNPIVESKHPHPSTLKYVVHGCVIHRIRRSLSGSFRTLHAREVAVEGLRGREAGKASLLQVQSAVQKAASARGIDQKPGMDVERLIARAADDRCAILCQIQGLDPSALAVVDSKALRFLDEELIYLGPVPMRIGDTIMRARRHKQLLCVMRSNRLGLSQAMVEESEAALESAGNLRIFALPASPFCQRRNPRQIIGCAKPFQQEIAKRRGGFADRHAGMLAPLEQDDRKAELMGDHRHQASAKAGADDREINVAGQLAPPQWVHGILSSTVCCRFICRSRAARCAWQCAHDSRRPQRSAKTLPALSRKPYSIADSSVCKARRRKLTTRNKSFHGSVSCTRRDERHGSGAMFHGKFQRALSPRQRLSCRHERRLHQDKDPQIDPVAAQEVRPQSRIDRASCAC